MEAFGGHTFNWNKGGENNNFFDFSFETQTRSSSTASSSIF
ncbi:hypothetical protein Patl1_22067 [Pistacia atlantica]|uniref:Uncharacterized protein n=1 Tax=Pistacia atlantica TaxID=434234 RepID=A0ACC1BK14_9ROSI|nr:hypothetical protein Patl1_22067 [Pistacia atlantica]